MPTDRMGRRSRFARTRTGKRLVLSDRDTEILRLLYRYRYLRATQLIAFLKPRSEKRFIERLGDLYHETALIARPKAQWRSFDARYRPMIYELSPKGERHLRSLGTLPHRATNFVRESHPGRTPQFDHAMMIVDALVAVELETIETPGERFVPMDEILERAPEQTRKAKNPLAVPVTVRPGKTLPRLKAPLHTHVIPDSIYGIEYVIDGEKRYRFWALECENTSPIRRRTARCSSLALKRAAYDALITSGAHKRVWEIPNVLLHVHPRGMGDAL